MRGQPNIIFFRAEVWVVTCVQSLHVFSRRTAFAHVVQDVKKGVVLLPIHVFESYCHVRYLRKCMTSEEIRGGIVRLQHVCIFVGYDGSELLKVAYHEQLYATKGLRRVLKATQYRVDCIQKVAAYHTDFIDDEQVERLDDIPFLLGYTVFSLDNGIWNVRRKGQLKERMNGHTTRIDGRNARGCNDNKPLFALFHDAFEERGLACSGLSRKENARSRVFHKLPSLL